jgi:hypothetical protein
MELRVRNVNDALPAALQLLAERGEHRDSRNGPVSLFREPVMTTYERPRERVLFNPPRDANPFFHLFESLWMLSGRDDVKFVERFVKRMRTFSDDGKTLHGAYGRRWISWFGYDQLQMVIDELRKNPDSRRCVIGMWDPTVDLPLAVGAGNHKKPGKDVPCNTQIFVSIGVDGRLEMTLLNRSNDIIWGAYGANAVHFSYLHEYLATAIGVEVGRFFQLSNNLHAYHATLEPLVAAGGHYFTDDPYHNEEVEPFPLMSTELARWREDLSVFMDVGPTPGLRDPFFRRVAIPMWVAHEAYKSTDGQERFDLAREALENCKATDWRRAALEWLERREKKVNEPS